MPKTEVIRLRLTPEELDSWKAEAKHARTSVSAFVRDCVDARCRLHATLREEDERRAHLHQMQREAARRLPKRRSVEILRAQPPCWQRWMKYAPTYSVGAVAKLAPLRLTDLRPYAKPGHIKSARLHVALSAESNLRGEF
jgi:Mobilization protein NikA